MVSLYTLTAIVSALKLQTERRVKGGLVDYRDHGKMPPDSTAAALDFTLWVYWAYF